MREAVHRERHEEGTDRIMVEEGAIGLSGGNASAPNGASCARAGPNNPHSAHQHVVAPHTYADVLIHRTVVACEVTSRAFLPLAAL